jgi:hypothetical protein
MIFPQYNYKNFHLDNKDEHPIQPYSIDGWCKMVNDCDKYCKKFNWWKWVMFYFWYNVGRFKYHNLPSQHPYWKIETNKDLKKTLNDLLIKYNACKRNPDKIKYHFNSSTTITDIERTIADIKSKLK